MKDEKMGAHCSNPTCHCTTDEGSEYCGEYCRNSRGEAQCHCGHPECH